MIHSRARAVVISTIGSITMISWIIQVENIDNRMLGVYFASVVDGCTAHRWCEGLKAQRQIRDSIVARSDKVSLISFLTILVFQKEREID